MEQFKALDIKSYNSPDEVPPELDPNIKQTYINMLRQKEMKN